MDFFGLARGLVHARARERLVRLGLSHGHQEPLYQRELDASVAALATGVDIATVVVVARAASAVPDKDLAGRVLLLLAGVCGDAARQAYAAPAALVPVLVPPCDVVAELVAGAAFALGAKFPLLAPMALDVVRTYYSLAEPSAVCAFLGVMRAAAALPVFCVQHPEVVVEAVGLLTPQGLASAEAGANEIAASKDYLDLVGARVQHGLGLAQLVTLAADAAVAMFASAADCPRESLSQWALDMRVLDQLEAPGILGKLQVAASSELARWAAGVAQTHHSCHPHLLPLVAVSMAVGTMQPEEAQLLVTPRADSAAAISLAAVMAAGAPETVPAVVAALAAFVALPHLSTAAVETAAAATAVVCGSTSQELVVLCVYALNNLVGPQAAHAADGVARPLVNAVAAMVTVAREIPHLEMATLVVTLLTQKVQRGMATLDRALVDGLARCAPFVAEREVQLVIRLLTKIVLDPTTPPPLVEAVVAARVRLGHVASTLPALFKPLFASTLTTIVALGHAPEPDHHRPQLEIAHVARQMEWFLEPLAAMLPEPLQPPLEYADPNTARLVRDMWFNLAVHGFTEAVKGKVQGWLVRIAHLLPPLALEFMWDGTELSLELNTVLRRRSLNTSTKTQRQLVEAVVEHATRGSGLLAVKLSFRQVLDSKVMFLAAMLMVERLRLRLGACAVSPLYLLDPSVQVLEVDRYVGPIAMDSVGRYLLRVYQECHRAERFLAHGALKQATELMVLCMHRLPLLQDVADQCCDVLVKRIPLVLCHYTCLATLLDLLTVAYDAIVDADTSQYAPRTQFKTNYTGTHLLLPDSRAWRVKTFERMVERAQQWVQLAKTKAPHDVSSLLRDYVAECGKDNGSRVVAPRRVEYGVLFALQMAGSTEPSMSAPIGLLHSATAMAGFILLVTWRSAFNNDLMEQLALAEPMNARRMKQAARDKVALVRAQGGDAEVLDALELCAQVLLLLKHDGGEFMRYVVELPFVLLGTQFNEVLSRIWLSILRNLLPDLVLLVLEIVRWWKVLVARRQGLFLGANNPVPPEFQVMEYLPSDLLAIVRGAGSAEAMLQLHRYVIQLLQLHFNATRFTSALLLQLFTEFCSVGLASMASASTHPLARVVRFELVEFLLLVMRHHLRLGTPHPGEFMDQVFDALLRWFEQPPAWPYGSNALQLNTDRECLRRVARELLGFSVKSVQGERKRAVLLQFMDDEIARMGPWVTPLNPTQVEGEYIDTLSPYSLAKLGAEKFLAQAYALLPRLAVNLVKRQIKGTSKDGASMVRALVEKQPLAALRVLEVVEFLLPALYTGAQNEVGVLGKVPYQLVYLPLVLPIDAINMFLPPANRHPIVIQYAMRVLEGHDVNTTFFYVPQIVQILRYDGLGYVERFILETLRVLEFFAHQIVWNMKANSYKDEEATVEDLLKPTLDRVKQHIIEHLTPAQLSYYEREFSFFDEVTGISGKLKPFIGKPKLEKKAAIDVEMARIKVEKDVYLPSDPTGKVVDIERTLGRPLQLHAKAPFMATFKIRKEVASEDGTLMWVEKRQAAIFKVGDDCRQDVLALQLILVFRTVWMACGLDMYVFPYRVTASAPGCGVIDVLPNLVLRDMLGREAVNELFGYFVSKFGPEDLIGFQTARTAFVKSLAAYLIILYLLRFKDRHNGNIMYDDHGHILHIDFGFCFDIAPGGVTFEAVPFKLTEEMVMVMGGSTTTQAFQWFEELCVKGFLACRPHMELIVQCVLPMLDLGLPCFQGKTIKHLRKRFVPAMLEEAAAHYMRKLVRELNGAIATGVYDRFQKMTNGIPY